MGKFRRALVVVIGLSTSIGVVAVDAPPAAAAPSGVYIVTPKWWGWCPNVGRAQNRVVFVSITNTTTGYSQTDSGDDIGWSNVALGRRNTIHVNVGCALGHGSTGTVVTITPTRHRQTFWVSPTGASYGN